MRFRQNSYLFTTWQGNRRQLNFAFLLPLLMACGFLPNLSAQMKLLSQDTGWFVSGGRLLWTSDNGANWKDITPSGPTIPKGAKLGSAFFLDFSEGWATLSYPEPIAAPTPQALANQKTLYSIAHTDNGGETWNAGPLNYPALSEPAEETFGGPVSLYFLDSMHGWIDVTFQSMFNPGKLLATGNGGQTWDWVNSPIHSGPLYFHTREDGWIISNYGGRQLYVTHDGAKSWQETHLNVPLKLASPLYSEFLEMPVFKDEQNGYLAVNYYGPGYSSPTLLVYSTKSGGKSWRLLKSLPVSTGTHAALVDSVVILPTNSGASKPSTESVSLRNESQPAQKVTSQDESGILAFSFLDEKNGWAFKVSRPSGLFSTADGGATWRNISPPSQLPNLEHIIIRPGKPVKLKPTSGPGS